MSKYNKFIIEARTKDGKLDMNNRVPFLTGTMDQICDYYFFHNSCKSSATMEEIHQFYNKKGWFIRRKTW